ncbi:hypothetical protein [Phocaeicola plebeius]|uniref:hypothetical protein n=1 Tax=Phocaeicola plebeius TaxID=310297 RepID=UPI00266CB4F4|nr:hypothetical protein [Phocaeicola plebeius]
MSVFTYRKKTIETNFRSRSEAFNSMLAYLIEEKKMDPMQAAKEANEFAEIFAVNMGLPTKVDPERKGYDKVMYYVKETVTMVKENPEIVNYLIPAVTFVAGLFTGKKTEQVQESHEEQPVVNEPIDFDNVK